jgi:putative tryptophan/tyrosine transport system substrate-binding protein
MKRREFIAGLSGAAAWPVVVARGQQPERMRRIGLFFTVEPRNPVAQQYTQVLLQGMHELGWIVGTNFEILTRFGGISDIGQIQTAAKELVSTHPDLILTAATPGTAAILKETRTIPVVFGFAQNPVGFGFVESFAHPGGNATGFVNHDPSMGGKWVQILKEVVPCLSHATLLFNPPMAAPTFSNYAPPIEAAAKTFGITLRKAPVENVTALEPEIIAISRDPDAGLIVFPDTFMYVHREAIISLANRAKLPAVYPYPEFAREGELLSYGVDLLDLYRRSASYIDRILKGAKPADLPVQFPVKFQFVINLKTARALDLTVPPTLLARADEVIE